MIEARNKADQLCFQTEKFIKDNEAKISAGVKENVNKAIEDVRKALKEEAPKDKLDAAVSDLEAASHKMAEEAYKAAPGAEGQAPGAEGPEVAQAASAKKPDGDVIDADFKVVDEKK